MKKQFNLEAALNGEPFECQDGSKVLKWIYCEECEDFPILCFIKRYNGNVHSESYTKEGRFYQNQDNALNLVMSPKKVTRWFNVFEHSVHGIIIGTTVGFQSESEAKQYNSHKDYYITTIPIEIELP
jgi:hypothetical protein